MLSERQLLILYKIIEYFSIDGQPVSSKVLVADGFINASSATIRNEMSFLEELDYIQKVHSSSGRIPSVKGYRFYVDHLMRPKDVKENEHTKIKSVLDTHIFEMNDVFFQSAELLSELTNYTAIVLGPQSKESTLTGFRILFLNNKQMMLVLQIDNFEVQNLIVKAPAGISTADIKEVTNFVNKYLVGESIATVNYALAHELPRLFEKYLEVNWDIVEMLKNTLFRFRDDQLFVSGKMNLLDFTQSMETHQVKDLYGLLENEVYINSLFNESKSGSNPDIRIGAEFEHQLFEPLSLITVPYSDKEIGAGFIAVLGPVNMTYDTTLGVIQVLRDELLDRLEDFHLE